MLLQLNQQYYLNTDMLNALSFVGSYTLRQLSPPFSGKVFRFCLSQLLGVLRISAVVGQDDHTGIRPGLGARNWVLWCPPLPPTRPLQPENLCRDAASFCVSKQMTGNRRGG